jgi:hypothetical protein
MTVLLDAAGRRRPPVTMPGYHPGRPPGNQGVRYPADPPTVDEIVAVMRHTGDDRHDFRLRAMVVVLWRRAEAPRGARARRPRPRPAAWIPAGPPRQGRPAARGRHGRVGRGAATPIARRAGGAAGRAAVLHHRRAHPEPALVGRGGAYRVPPRRGAGRCAAYVRAASAAPRTRARAGPGGRAAQHHPTPTRAYNLGTTSIYLQACTGGDHGHHPHAPAAHDVCQRRTQTLTRATQEERERRSVLPLLLAKRVCGWTRARALKVVQGGRAGPHRRSARLRWNAGVAAGRLAWQRRPARAIRRPSSR